jgi:hypothetical protein
METPLRQRPQVPRLRVLCYMGLRERDLVIGIRDKVLGFRVGVSGFGFRVRV